MKRFVISILCVLSLNLYAQQSQTNTIATEKTVDVKQFLGKWYAVAALPQFFSRGCLYQTAEYGLIDQTTLSVKNTCYKDNKRKWIYGKAYVTNTMTNSELIVRFNTWWARLFNIKGDYNIIKIDNDYQTVMVGSKNRKSLWIMTRTKGINKQKYQEYVNYAKKLNFPIHNLIESKF